MKTPRSEWIVCLATFTAAGLLGPTVSAAPSFKLTEAVPDDVFVCVAGRHNPEREFLDAYWQEVFDALKASGVVGDVMDLLRSFLGDDQKAEAERFKALATELFDAVDWKGLWGGEVVFAERWNTPDIVGRNVNMGPPEMVVMFRAGEESVARNFDGLKAILKTVVNEGNKAAGKDILEIREASHVGVPTCCTLKVKEQGGQEVPFSISLAQHGDVILIVQGDKLLHDTLDLLAGDASAGSLAVSPRFKEAFAKLPPANDALVFFDMRQMLKMPRTILQYVTAEQERTGGDAIINFGSCKDANALNREALGAYRDKDYKKALNLITAANELAPQDSLIMYNVACFQALNGHKEEAMSWLEKSVDAGFYSPKQIADDSDLESLRNDPRFTAALNKAKEMAASRGDKGEEARKIQRIGDLVIDIPGIFDYVATVEYTTGHSVHSETLTALVEGADAKPLYKVFSSAKPLTGFQRYLPKETVSFSVEGIFDLNEAYTFLEDTIRSFGTQGEQILAKWNALQEQFGFNVRRDLLSWLSGECITMELDSGASVWMIKVSDEQVARQKLDAALGFVSTQLKDMATQNPMLAMLAIQTSPCTHEKLAGFHNVQFGMSPKPAVCGVVDGYMVLGTSADALALSLATAAGDHPNVTKNDQVMAEAVVPQDGFQSVTFADRRSLNKDIRKVLEVITMAGGFAVMAIPDPQAQQAATKALGIVAKLGPVVGKIDFYKSTASCTTFDANGWRVHQVTNYREPVKTASGGY